MTTKSSSTTTQLRAQHRARHFTFRLIEKISGHTSSGLFFLQQQVYYSLQQRLRGALFNV